MKNLKSTIVLFGVLIALLSMHAVAAQSGAMGYQAYLSGSTTIWERIINAKSGQFDRAMAQYGFLNATMASKDEAAFDKYYESTVDLLKEEIENGQRHAEARAVLSSVYGLAMAYDSWKGMYLGPKSGTLIADAFKESPDNALIVKLYAGSKLYTPEMFGGDAMEAQKQFEVCVGLYEAQGDTIDNWLYLDALAHLGIALKKNGRAKAAVSVYEKALAIEPDFSWVKYSLLPSAQKLLAGQ